MSKNLFAKIGTVQPGVGCGFSARPPY
uniref:Uncharacterized protein n=1 Tax=Anguilla anguilla TaxID=7936 RepID=A0A0E9ULU9_ANGAN